MADDPSTHRIFLMRFATDFTVSPPVQIDQIVTVDSRGGGIRSVSPALSCGLSSFAFDGSSGTLFGVSGGTCPTEIVRVDPGTGVETNLAPVIGDAFSTMAIAPALHKLYLGSETFGTFPATVQLLTMDTQTDVVTPGPVVASGFHGLVYDTMNGGLFATTFLPTHLVRVDPITGVETQVGSYDFGSFLEPGIAIDSASHVIFVVQDVFDPLTGPIAHIASINDESGAGALGASTGRNLGPIVFESSAITPASLAAKVQQALSSGAIDNSGVANALLAQLNAAAAARANGQCPTAANIYTAFINAVNAQSGSHIAAATAAQLVSEAQFLIANCP